ncbi:nucleotide sugar dehydrogenase [Listeria aquatica]|uniref:Nucleotide sugar dehydrogenase n=1 Tax=Listeria aquatica TaxID=1494960 RepID=A0A841ZSD9_9LIST|nr:nucleotide sugar dehydrogenase [Listeria aquatica]MBC1522322.1 nucleotide sugar dehydrogenase [Listeria aquatica]
MKLTVLGLGYIGLPTAVMFANHGVQVRGFDTSPAVIEALQNNKIHIEENGLQEAFEDAVEDNLVIQNKMEKSDVFIIAVPTPNKIDKSCDMTYVLQAVKEVLPFLEKGNTVIVESTIEPRATRDLVAPLISDKGFIIGKDIFLVHCPERVLPGQILRELEENNRIIGGMTEACANKGAEIYQTFVKGKCLKTDTTTAELSKLMENTYRDVNIALANELVLIAEVLGANALHVIELANEHQRVHIHNPGPGVGGHCLAVDPYFIISKAPEQAKLIEQARDINCSMPNFVVKQIDRLMDEAPTQKIVILGLTYKGNVDDMRESPALEIVERLKRAGRYEIELYDPHVKGNSGNKELLMEKFCGASLAVVLADHNEFMTLDHELVQAMAAPKVFDTKQIVQESRGLEIIRLGNSQSVVGAIEV